MDSFIKRTSGEVQQRFKKNRNGDFVCTSQEFIAGDICDYIDENGEFIDPPEYIYQPYGMIAILDGDDMIGGVEFEVMR